MEKIIGLTLFIGMILVASEGPTFIPNFIGLGISFISLILAYKEGY